MLILFQKNTQWIANLGVKGKDTTPFLLDKIQKLTEGSSLKANIELVFNNTKLATKIAKELANLEK